MQKATEPEGTLSTQICVVCSIEIIEEELWKGIENLLYEIMAENFLVLRRHPDPRNWKANYNISKKVLLQNWKRNSVLPDKQNLKEFIIPVLALQEMPERLLQTQWMDENYDSGKIYKTHWQHRNTKRKTKWIKIYHYKDPPIDKYKE
jgi:hypothetical protein